MNHKRGKPKSARAGCRMCKPNKLGKGMENELGHRGFGKLRKEASADDDLRTGDAAAENGLGELWDFVVENGE